MYNLSDEKLVEEHWEMNIYFQYFSGKEHQHWGSLVKQVIWFALENVLKKKELKKYTSTQ